MRKNLTYFSFLVIGLISLFTANLSAQNKVSVDNNQPQATPTDKVLQNYIDISSLPMNKRPKAFSNLAAEDKGNLFKFHLALQLVKRPNLTKEQRDIILDGISMITSETYSRETPDKIAKAQQENNLLEAKAKSAFPGRAGFEIFANLSGDATDIQILKEYQQVTSFKYQVERRTAFSRLSVQAKSSTMKIHLALQMANRSLNKGQLEFIEEAVSLFSPEIYDAAKGTVEWKQVNDTLNSLKDRMLISFQKEDAFEIFASLGGEAGSPGQTEQAPNCSCSGVSDYCGWWRSGATCGGGGCRSQVNGCGTGLWHDCDGMCTGGGM